ncbi:MAG TPA: peptidase S8 [Saprospirales bacterium]|nr:peptidase S8 [Saprospirales bacterium]
MPRFFLPILLNLFISSLFAQNLSTKIAPELRAAIQRGESPDVLVIFREKADISQAKQLPSKSAKAQFVFQTLQQTAARSQKNALELVRQSGAAANSLFLVNAISLVKAPGNLLQRIAELPEVSSISADPWVKFDGPVEQNSFTTTSQDRNGVEWGVAKIQAPEVWAQGYTGQGITVGGADTGYDWGHPAILKKYRGYTGNQHDYNWHDAIHDLNPLNNDTSGNPGVNPCGLNSQAPCDDNSHGTHTMGTMTGDDEAGNMIGVAPGAQWVGCRNMERGWGKPSTYLECFQWFLAPTDLGGQNPDPDKAPHVINNSWYCPEVEGCTDLSVNELIHVAVVNLKESGVVVVVSNGNAGPACASTFGPPAYFEESFSIGSTRHDDLISPYSNRGPVKIDGSDRIKPNVSAPGQDVRSSVPGGNYANYSGTSMAGPHVAGLVALVISARPEIAGFVDDIEDIVEQTAVYLSDTLDCDNNLGTARPNHAFGWGRVDALGAVQAALEWEAPVNSANVLLQPEVSVSPNPASDAVWFQFDYLKGETTLEILNQEGKQILLQQWQAQGRESRRIDLARQPAGVYFWKLKSESGVTGGKLVVRGR